MSMPATLRLTKDEQRRVKVNCREINKILVSMERAPVQESELLHRLIDLTVDKVKVNKRGEIVIEP
jgi:hypothetical protein